MNMTRCPRCNSPLYLDRMNDNEPTCISAGHTKYNWHLTVSSHTDAPKSAKGLGEPCKVCGRPKNGVYHQGATPVAFCEPCRSANGGNNASSFGTERLYRKPIAELSDLVLP